jgi:hypothetical protein
VIRPGATTEGEEGEAPIVFMSPPVGDILDRVKAGELDKEEADTLIRQRLAEEARISG